MNRSIRSLVLPVLTTCAALAVRLSGADAPTPTPDAKPAAVVPAAGTAAAPAPKVTPLVLPKQLEGVITQEEFETYIKFQQEVRERADVKAINDEMRAKRTELIDLQKKSQAAIQAQIEARPDIKAITDKIRTRNARPSAIVPPGAAPAPHAVITAPAAVTPTPVAK